MKAAQKHGLLGRASRLGACLLLCSPASAWTRGLGATAPRVTVARASHYQTAQRSSPPATPLTEGRTLRVEIKDGEPQAVGVTLGAGQCARVVFLWGGIDLTVTVFKPDGTRLAESPTQVKAPGPVSVTVIADAAGEYRFEMQPAEGWKVNVGFEVRLAFVGQPDAAAGMRVAAERALAESARLAGAAAAEKIGQALRHWQEAGDAEGEAAALHALADLYKVARNLKDAEINYRKAQELRRKLEDPAGEAHALQGLGDAVRRTSTPAAAIPFYEQALALFRKARNRPGESSALYSIGFSLMIASKYREALKFHADALAIQSADDDRVGEARTLNALGGAYDRLGDYAEALAHYQRAIDIRQKLGDRLGMALIASNNVGVIHDNLGDWQRAKESYEAALTTYESLLGSELRTCAEQEVAGQAAKVCDYAAAALDNLGELYNSMGDPQAALVKFADSLVISLKRGDKRQESSTYSHMCYSHLLLGEPREALTWCDKVLPPRTPQAGAASYGQQKPVVDADTLGYAYIVAGMSHDELGEASTAAAYFAEALKIHVESGDPRGQAMVLEKAGAALVRAGDAQGALKKLGDALTLWRQIRDQNGEALTLYQMARAAGVRGDLPTAHARVMEAVDLIESLRVKVTAQRLRASYFAQKLDCYELAIDLKMRLAKAGGLGVASPEALVASALHTSERARARVLFDILAEARVEPRGGPDQALEGLLRRRQGLQQRLDYKAALQTRLLAAEKPDDEKPAAELATLEKELSQLAAEYDDVDAQLRARNPRYAELARPQPLSVAEIQSQLLDEETLLLEYALGEERSYLWVVSQHEVKPFELRGRSEIEGAALRVRKILKDEQKQRGEPRLEYETRLAGLERLYRKEAGLLSEMLLGPAAAELGRKRLLVAAGGELQQVPFAALPAPGKSAAAPGGRLPTRAVAPADASAPPLAATHEIVNLPSASTLAALRAMTQKRQRPPMSVAVLADPVFDQKDGRLEAALRKQPNGKTPAPRTPTLEVAVRESYGANLPRLVASRREATAIVAAAPADTATAWLDFAANRTTATAAGLTRYRIVHFATHAVFNDKQPELSGVVLSFFDERAQPREDGFLRLHDIYNLSLPVDMVVLSACQTGDGKRVRGEGLIGLTRGFMYAGAPRVVASLWKVDDEATAELMNLFYQRMLRDGMSPPAALRDAQMALRRQTRWSAPYYWAGFILQGEWK